MLLESRFAADADQAAAMKQRVIELQQQVPALNECRLVSKILDRWEVWAGSERCPDETGDIFGACSEPRFAVLAWCRYTVCESELKLVFVLMIIVRRKRSCSSSRVARMKAL